jgi:ribonuclease HII
MALIVGIDEVGRGCLAGPVYAAAVVMEETQTIAGLKDSKLLSKKKRRELFKSIIKSSFEYSIASLDNKRIDELNILNASLEAMENSIKLLNSGFSKGYIDGPHIPKNLLQQKIKYKPIIGGDNLFPCISAASIIAKVSRDKYMNEIHDQYPEYGFMKNKGYPTKQHICAIQKFGPTPFHRLTFKPELYE